MDIDLDYSQMDAIQKPEHRTISSRSRDISKFISIIHRHCINNNIFKQLEQYSTQDKETIIRLGNKIDQQLTMGIMKALKSCSKKPYYPWSATLHEASLRVKFWKIALTIPSSKLTPALEIIRTTINDVPPLLPARTVRKKRLKNAMIQLRKIRKDLASHRKTFLHNLKQTIVTRQKSNQYDPLKALEQVEKMERKKQHFLHIKRTFNAAVKNPLVQVKIPTFTEHIHPETGQIMYIDNNTNQQIKRNSS